MAIRQVRQLCEVLSELELRYFFRFVAANPITVMQMFAPKRVVVGADEIIMLDNFSLVVVPPFLFLIQASLTVGSTADARYALDNFVSVLSHSGAELWVTTILYAIGSSLLRSKPLARSIRRSTT